MWCWNFNERTLVYVAPEYALLRIVRVLDSTNKRYKFRPTGPEMEQINVKQPKWFTLPFVPIANMNAQRNTKIIIHKPRKGKIYNFLFVVYFQFNSLFLRCG
jgi:hypothetical protein